MIDPTDLDQLIMWLTILFLISLVFIGGSVTLLVKKVFNKIRGNK